MEGSLSTVAPAPLTRKNSFQAKHAMWIVFGLMTVFVVVTRDRTLLDHKSFLRQRYAAIPWLMYAHGIPGALALLLGAFQFSNRLGQRYLQVHRVLGRIYVGCVAISAPVAIAVSISLPMMTLTMASIIQALGCLVTTATGLYCVRTGRIQHHPEGTMRSYHLPMLFIVVPAPHSLPPPPPLPEP